ncbi:MAG: hypothetical protein ABW200_02740 [Hyphomicrobiaceae bacterium]
MLSQQRMRTRRDKPDLDAAGCTERARPCLTKGTRTCRSVGRATFVRREATGRNAGESRQPANSLQRRLPEFTSAFGGAVVGGSFR